ncbi:hypothetical protein D3C76_1675850 [compost metagenome]
MSDITGFSANLTAPLTWNSPDGTKIAVLENKKLIIYKVTADSVNEKSIIQTIDLVGTWVMGEWSVDSTVFTYHVQDLDGKVSVYSCPKNTTALKTPK